MFYRYFSFLLETFKDADHLRVFVSKSWNAEFNLEQLILVAVFFHAQFIMRLTETQTKTLGNLSFFEFIIFFSYFLPGFNNWVSFFCNNIYIFNFYMHFLFAYFSMTLFCTMAYDELNSQWPSIRGLAKSETLSWSVDWTWLIKVWNIIYSTWICEL